MKFTLSKIEEKAAKKFMARKNAEMLQKQKEMITPAHKDYGLCESFWDCGGPYQGAIGGSFTFSFTPNSIGHVVKIRYDIDGEEEDISDYNW